MYRRSRPTETVRIMELSMEANRSKFARAAAVGAATRERDPAGP